MSLEEEYTLVCKVYENYIEFEGRLTTEINKFQSHKAILNILEIGTGTGITTKIILSCKKNVKLLSIDNNNKTIILAKNKFKHEANIDFVCADALEYIQNTNKTFDIIVSAFTLHNFKYHYRSHIYKAIYSKMNDNALFLNADKYSPDDDRLRNTVLQNIIGKYFDVFTIAGKIKLLKYWVLHYIEDQSPEKVMKLRISQDIMANNKFNNIKVVYQDKSKMLALLKAEK